ncbi:hypothetical protein JOF35_008161 [Streptomyces demainii]|uniref:Secreted protein n=1 Tax=Streptomyces demainii TaxID=588122 RepID=A0ABT9L532_9ACTN|nr:hypothetical protein [Streptomyces demainii]
MISATLRLSRCSVMAVVVFFRSRWVRGADGAPHRRAGGVPGRPAPKPPSAATTPPDPSVSSYATEPGRPTSRQPGRALPGCRAPRRPAMLSSYRRPCRSRRSRLRR